MSIKRFFKQEFRLRNFLLQHEVGLDFYLSCLQRNRSLLPLLLIRGLIFAGCISVLITSLVMTKQFMPLNFWAIYMTHWGLVMNTLAAGLGFLVSIMGYLKPPSDSKGELPWYVQSYWAMFNLAVTIAFFITVFYWTLLTGLEQDFAINFTLDILIHGVNSILMFGLLVTSRTPTYFLHAYIPIVFGLVYLIFSYAYYALGGLDGFGSHAIYPMLDWKNPGTTIALAALCTFGILILHVVTVGIGTLRDYVTRRFRKDNTAYDVHEAYY